MARFSGLTTRGRCLLAGGVATAVCSVVLDERDLLRIGAFVAVLPLLAALLAVRTRRAVRVTRELSPPRLPRGRRGRGHAARARLRAGRRAATGGHRARRRGTAGDRPAGVHHPPPLRPRRRHASPIPCGRRCAGCTPSARSRWAPPTRSCWPSSSARSPRPTGWSCCPGWSRSPACPRRSARARARPAPRSPTRARAARTSWCVPTGTATSCGGCTGAAPRGTTS